ncbi:acyltransferase family protein [Ruminococcus flavefaciens]|uniref:acyltransferase family protein n=1 Tax=Ruminococcus flavefaciens TaxID=1265 RepID=UPI0026EE8A12|nr:acyltransferase family protein [Ruminococcus flavefaciens]
MAKENKKFMLLSAIGIIMVIDAHTWGAFGILTNYFPFNSFFMPMFVFISGYFNKIDQNTDLSKYTIKKFKTLMLPYFGISIPAIFIDWLLKIFKTGTIPPLSFNYFLRSCGKVFTSGIINDIVSPMWFVPMLFSVQIIYALLKKALYKQWNSKTILIFFLTLHIYIVWYVKEYGVATYKLFLFKIIFFIPFIELGIIYRNVLEEKLKKISPILLLSCLLLINMIRTMIMPSSYDIAFNSLFELSGFSSPYPITPMISSIIGILFWLEIIEMIGSPLYGNRIINYISDNTFFIMGFHIIMFNLLNCILFIINKFIELPGFDIETFQGSNWYRWEHFPQFRYAYFLVGLFGSLALKQIYNRFIKKPVAGRMKVSAPAKQS